jgi:hypothetical protein
MVVYPPLPFFFFCWVLTLDWSSFLNTCLLGATTNHIPLIYKCPKKKSNCTSVVYPIRRSPSAMYRVSWFQWSMGLNLYKAGTNSAMIHVLVLNGKKEDASVVMANSRCWWYVQANVWLQKFTIVSISGINSPKIY